MHEFPHLVARAAETPEHLPTGAVHDIYLLVYLIDYVHEFLAWIAGKFHGRTRSHQHRFPPRSGSRRWNRSPHLGSGRKGVWKIAHGVEHLNPIHPPIAYVHQAIITHADAMHGWRSRGACLLRRSVQFPLAQVVSGLIKHHDAKIIAATPFRMSIGDVHVAIVWIESDFRHPEKLRRACVQGRAGDGAVRGVENAPLSDLQQKFSPLVRIFLHDAVLGSIQPHMALAVDRAAVEILWKQV